MNSMSTSAGAAASTLRPELLAAGADAWGASAGGPGSILRDDEAPDALGFMEPVRELERPTFGCCRKKVRVLTQTLS